MVRVYLMRLFVGLMVGFAVLKSPPIAPLIDAYCLALAQASGVIVGTIDTAVVREGAVLYRSSYGHAVEVAKACSALDYNLVLATAILLLPLSWPQKLAAVALSFVFVQGLNLLRIITLIYGKALLLPSHFDLLHSQIFVFILTLLVSLFFVALLYRHRQQFAALDDTAHVQLA